MLYERHVECAAVDAVYDRLAAGRGAVLVLRGEAGVGKSAVLDYARAQRGACRVLSMVGVETEQPMAYSGVHELLHEDFHLMDALPPAQRAALRAALGFEQGAADRFLVCLAVLAVLSDAASSGLVCLVDDLQWLDSASIDVLSFAGRRLASEPVAFVVAVRSDMSSLPFPDGVVVDVGGLGVAAAAAMLAAVHGSTVAEAVAGELVARTGGNPLALGELARALPSAVLSGAAPLPDPMPVGASVQAAFARQVSGYPDATRLMLLIAAAEHADLGTVLGVAAELGADAAALEVAETDGVVRVTESGIEFRHPLIRSTVYGTAGFLRRQGVHRGYAAVLTDDRRAWHLAAAASGTDESVAQLLDAAAYRAAAHGALNSAASTWERAAALSAEDARRGARLVQAASASWSAGHAERVPVLLTQAQHCPLDRFGSARATLVRGRYETRKGVMTEGAKLLLDAAGDAVTDDPRLAIDIALEAMMASLYGGDPAGFVAAGRLADGLPAGTGELEFYRRICAGIGRIFAGDQDGAAGLLSSAGAPPDTAKGWLCAGHAAAYSGTADWGRCYELSVARARAEGAIGELPHSLARLANAYRYRGDLDGAVIAATEGLQLARETGQEADACLLLAELAVGAALRGDEPECRRRADEALGTAIPRRITFAAGMATWAVGLLELSAGRPDLALSAFQSINDPTSPVANVALAMFTIADLIEAAVRDGRHQVGREKLPGLLAWAQTSRRGNALVVAARSNALLDDDLDRYVEALSVQANDVSAVERARTELLYGEALRRRRQPAAAREPLRSALDVFSRLGMAKWAERARIELRAAGVVTAHHSATRPASALTTQELQIARLVADGASNRAVAAALFLSPRTVEYHLYKIFPKLGIASRAELATLDLGQPALPQQAAAP